MGRKGQEVAELAGRGKRALARRRQSRQMRGFAYKGREDQREAISASLLIWFQMETLERMSLRVPLAIGS